MNYTRVLKFAINAYVICAVLALLATAFSGGFSFPHTATRLWLFPLDLGPSLVLLFVSLLAAYSLLYNSSHGRWLLSCCAVFFFLNLALDDGQLTWGLAAVVNLVALVVMVLVLYLAWTNPLPDKIKRLRSHLKR